MAVVVTACIGHYDTLRPPVEQTGEVDWLAFVEDGDTVPWPWKPVIVKPDPAEHPRMVAKQYKMAPVGASPDMVWVDANTEITSRWFVHDMLRARRNGIAVWAHPQRSCIYDEAEASLRLCPEKYAGQPIGEQVEHYRAEGHPRRAGLYACGTVAWDWSNPLAAQIGSAWWAECRRWSYQDQLSLPVVLRRLGAEPGIFPAGQIERRGLGWIGNRWQKIWPHLSAA